MLLLRHGRGGRRAPARWIGAARGLSAAILLLLYPTFPTSGPAEAAEKVSVVINQVDSSRFPTTTAYVTVTNEKGYPILGLKGGNFQVIEDGTAAPEIEVSTAVNFQEPLAAVIAIDVSGSMDAEALEEEKRAAIAFVNGLRPQDQASIIAFSSDVRNLVGFTADKGALVSSIELLQAGGNTALYDALFASVEATMTAASSRRVAILMTDGYNTKRGASLEDGLNLAAQKSVAVYTIGLGGDVNKNILTRIAQHTGGSSLFAPSPGDLEQSYQAIAEKLRNQYVITYLSPDPKGARTYHLSLGVSFGAARAKTEASYEAHPTPPSIAYLSLQDGQTVQGLAAVQVGVTASVPVTKVRLRVNGRVEGEVFATPFNLPLDTDGLSPGRQEVMVSVYDIAGSEATKRVFVLVPALPGSVEASGHKTSGAAKGTGIHLSELSWEQLKNALAHIAASSLERLTYLAQAGQNLLTELEDAGRLKLMSIQDRTGRLLAATTGTVRDNARTVTALGVLMAASLAGVLEVWRATGLVRQSLGWETCSSCAGRYRAYEEYCPHCTEEQRRGREEERSLSDFLVQSNLVTKEQLDSIAHVWGESGKTLEAVLVEEGLLSAGEISKARFYLFQSAEIQSRIQDVAEVQARRPAWPIKVRILVSHLSILLLTGAAFGIALSNFRR